MYAYIYIFIYTYGCSQYLKEHSIFYSNSVIYSNQLYTVKI